jgi:hypothetical protein
MAATSSATLAVMTIALAANAQLNDIAWRYIEIATSVATFASSAARATITTATFDIEID